MSDFRTFHRARREPAVPTQPLIDPAGWTAGSSGTVEDWAYRISDRDQDGVSTRGWTRTSAFQRHRTIREAIVKASVFASFLLASALTAGGASAQPFPFNDAGVTNGHWHLNSK